MCKRSTQSSSSGTHSTPIIEGEAQTVMVGGAPPGLQVAWERALAYVGALAAAHVIH